jgi:hypothetical protein
MFSLAYQINHHMVNILVDTIIYNIVLNCSMLVCECEFLTFKRQSYHFIVTMLLKIQVKVKYNYTFTLLLSYFHFLFLTRWNFYDFCDFLRFFNKNDGK